MPGELDLLRFPLAWAGVLVVLRLWRRRDPPLATVSDWLWCAGASVLFWDIFELVNLRLRDWWYTGVSPSFVWSGVFGTVSFATVLPAVRLMAGRPVLAPAQHRPLRLVLGLAMLALSLAFPRVAFPLAWIFLWPICEALAGARVPLRLAPLGLVLGLLWESLNWQCPRGWIYTVPHFEHPKLFEMPLPGYLGYLPFMLEALAALALVDRLRPRLNGALALCGVLAVHFAVNLPARRVTDLSFAPYQASGVPEEALRLERRTHMGIDRALAVQRRGWGALADDPAVVRVWIEKADSR
ncbi:MAG TPA: hypothetical protein VLW85_19510 [Myxococcales bacterium]|nr:hypothetical protein [Myxococcales bacterium]